MAVVAAKWLMVSAMAAVVLYAFHKDLDHAATVLVVTALIWLVGRFR